MSSVSLSLLLLSLAVRGSVQLCAPDCSGVDPGTKVRDPTDCTKYYECIYVSEAPFFDFMTGGCQSDDTLCYPYCNICEPHCTEYDQRVPDPLDCTRFYHCTPPTMSNFLCPHHQVFNRVSAQCEDNADCIVDC
ncbi:putative Chitin binding Peritrophin-A domain-containing protein 28 [Homarus americanus]|uniref:Putative Chitin binding Peritrophin-A domain-containing protein 28 n=1 Tax=Homarus americanus TaxID=6706 RepID=A0A8J5TNR2_HOMAM|nr:putative Chitin binding Peritrophin-A domain-containing protein 28 [Homarus americanus]